jgi:putative oxidoreductase
MRTSLVRSVIRTREDLWMTVPLRITLGIIFFAHGSQKLFGWFGGRGLQGTAETFAVKFGLTPGMFWAVLDTFGEFAGGILVFLGLFTRFGALNIAVVMVVAILRVHRRAFFLPSGMEFPVALLGSAIALMIAGGGELSLDALIQKKTGTKP